MSSWGRYLRTISELKMGQIAWRIPHQLRQRARKSLGPTAFDSYRPQPSALLAIEALPTPQREAFADELEIAARWSAGVVRIHGIERSREDWANAEMSRLWRYERQYHRELVALAIAARTDLAPRPPLLNHREEGSAYRGVPSRTSWATEARHLLESWLESCPPYRGEAWEPYPIARRILNWSQALGLLPELSDLLAPHLAGQVILLSHSLETHLGGNHLLCDAAALVAGSSVLEGEGLDACFAAGRQLLEEQLNAQVLADGGYAERTVQYHSIVLEDCSIAARLARARNRQLGASCEVALQRMAQWLAAVRGPLQRYPWLNDAAPDATPPFERVMAVVPSVPAPLQGDVELPETGWSIFRQAQHQLLFEHGPIGPPHQPGHGHSDALSFELIWDGIPVIVDSGVTTYEEGAIRTFERSAAAHAAVTVGGEGPDELWKSFRVGGRGRVSAEEPIRRPSGLRLVRGRLDAFQGWVHHRGLIFWPGVAAIVFDSVEGAHQEIAGRFPVAPGWKLSNGGSHLVYHRAPGLELGFTVLCGRFVGGREGQLAPRDGWVGEGFQKPVPRCSLQIAASLAGRMVAAFTAPEARVALEAHALTIESPRGREYVALDVLGLPA